MLQKNTIARDRTQDLTTGESIAVVSPVFCLELFVGPTAKELFADG
jgi:hypothetical protein